MTLSKSPDQTDASGARQDSQLWRRQRIVAMYAGYAALYGEILIHEHAARSWPAWLQASLWLLFAVTVLIILLTWGWLLSGAVRYGFGPGKPRRTGLAALRALKAQGRSASEVRAMVLPPPDERQQAVRYRAQAIAYQVSAAVVIAGALYGLLAGFFVPQLWLPHTPADLVPIAGALFLLYSTLPFAVVAWTEPDTPSQDGEGINDDQ